MNIHQPVHNQQYTSIRKESYANKQTKFTDYLDKKVKGIQQVKIKTIKTCEKYFQDLKEKTEKYLLKEQKRIINSFQDNINMSINCVTHNYLYNFDNMNGKRNENQNSPKLSRFQPENEQKAKNKIIENQNQLSVKLQMKKIFQQITVAENHLNEKLKLIGQDLKKQIQKMVQPLKDLLSKISKFTQIDTNVSTLIISDNKVQVAKKKNGTRKSKNNEILNVKNPQIFAQKKRISQLNQKQENFHSEMTDKLLKKSHIKHQILIQNRQNSFLLQLKPITEKQDHIAMSINKMIKCMKLVEFDLINKKSLLHIYEKMSGQLQLQQDILAQQGQNDQNENKAVIEIYLNEKRLKIEDNESNWIYQKYAKISFQSKPDREYLFILSSRISEIQVNQQVRKTKIYQFSIFNYKGDLIAKQVINGMKLSQTEKIIEIIQIDSHKEYIFLIFNNHSIRLNLKNIKNRKSLLYGTDEKIIKASVCEDKLVLFEGRKMVVQFMTVDFVLLQRFSWSSYYPNEVRLNKLLNLKMIHNENHQIDHHEQKQIVLLIPNIKTDPIHYIQNGFQKYLHFSYSHKQKHTKQRFPSLELIQSIICIDHEIYLIISSGFNVMKPKTDLFLLELVTQIGEQNNENMESQLKGKVTYLDTLCEDIVDCKFIKNQLYFQLKSGKINPYCIY